MLRDIITVATREVLARKLLFLGAGLCAIMALLTPFLPGARNESPLDVITTAALVLCILFMIGTPLLLGMGIISRDLEQRRMSFYLSRPINVFSVWAGKTLAAIGIAFTLTAIVVLIPTALGAGLLSIGGYAENVRASGLAGYDLFAGPLPSLILLSLFLLALAQYWGLCLRARTGWLLLDLATFIVTPVILWTGIRPFLLNSSNVVSSSVLTAALVTSNRFTIVAAVLLFIGSAAGLQLGRSDPRSVHKWTSIVTAILLLAGGTTFLLYSEWRRDLHPSEFVYSAVTEIPEQGPWIAVAGSRQDEWNAFNTAYLINTRTGVEIDITNSRPLISDDGRIAALWTREAINPPSATLHWIDLDDPEEIHRTGATMALEQNDTRRIRWSETDISFDGSRIAWIEDDTLHVYDLRADQSLFSAKLPADTYSTPLFDGNATVYAFSKSRIEGTWTIRTADIEARSWSVTGTMPSGYFIGPSKGALLRFISSRSPGEGRTDPRLYQLRRMSDGTVVRSFSAVGWDSS